jgi:hypothetical protein
MFRRRIIFFMCMILAGCATAPISPVASRQQAEADLVVTFQSWNSIWLIKPDIAGIAGALPEHTKTFTSSGVTKLLRNLRTPRNFVVVVLDRTHSPDPMVAEGGIDAVQKFFDGLGFRRIVFQDGQALRDGRPAVLRDTFTNQQ